MGVLLAWKDAVVKEAKEGMLDEFEAKLPPACESVTREIREDITRDWFAQGNANPESTIACYQYPTSIQRSGDTLSCTTHTFFEENAFHPASSTIEAWSARHGAGLNDVFIAELIHYKGEIVLPATGTYPLKWGAWNGQRPGEIWINEKYARHHVFPPLEPWILMHARWKSEWAQRVASMIGL